MVLALFLGKKIIGQLYFINDVVDHRSYELATTWFTGLLPDTLLTFSNAFISNLIIITIIVTVCASMGLLGRLNLIILSFLSFYVFGVSEGIGIFDHHISLPTQVILALALVPGTMKLSVDYFIWKKIIKKDKTSFLTNSENPKWGLNIILALVVLTYFTAGVSKLRYGHGLKWLDGSTLGFYLKEQTFLYKPGDVQLLVGNSQLATDKKWKDTYGFVAHTYANYQTSPKLAQIATYIANNKLLLVLLSVGSVLFELLAFIAFINSKYRNLYLIAAITFHLSIGALMGISFRQYRIICFFLIDWTLILNYVSAKLNNIKVLQKQPFQT